MGTPSARKEPMNGAPAFVPVPDEKGDGGFAPSLPRSDQTSILDDEARADRAATFPTDEDLLRRVSVVIPTLNEVDCIGHVLARIPTSVLEIIVVDGLSTDGTADTAAVTRPDVRIVRQ